MTASTRRAALGAILAAPLASASAVAAAEPLPDEEARFLAIGPQLVRLLDEYDRLCPLWDEPFEAYSTARERLTDWSQSATEALPEWSAYMIARAPADAVDEAIEALMQPFAGVSMTTLPAILLRLRYGMTFDAWLDDALDDLRTLWTREGGPCA